jgi:hypothetical protein
MFNGFIVVKKYFVPILYQNSLLLMLLKTSVIF